MGSRLQRVLGAVARQGVSVFSAIQQNVWMRGALALAGCFCAVRATLILTLLHVAKRLMGTALIFNQWNLLHSVCLSTGIRWLSGSIVTGDVYG